MLKIVYLYDENGLLLPLNSNTHNVQTSPLEEGVYLTPSNSTELEPNVVDGTWPVFTNGAWLNVLDFRGKVYYDTLGNKVVLTELGPVPTGLTLTPPPPSQADLLQVFLREVQSKLNASDITINRITEAVVLGETSWTTADVISYIQYRRTLRNLLVSGVINNIPEQPPYPLGT